MGAQGKCLGGLIDGVWPCDQVELLAQVPNTDTGGLNANDLWGWTDPEDGREYVLLGKRDGTWFIEVTDPSMPRVVGELPATGLANSLWRDIKVVGHHMVVVSEAVQSQLQVFDLTRSGTTRASDRRFPFLRTPCSVDFPRPTTWRFNPRIPSCLSAVRMPSKVCLSMTSASPGPHS